MDRLCVLRGFYTNNDGHSGGTYELLTGTEHPRGKGDNIGNASRTRHWYCGWERWAESQR